ncbi:NFACT RNA binding domain-containing protein [Entomospira culicis]|uniref:DUF814 domain-containing protein n=1 Tax=Entomospira culicis TaxID=2719989 RepID=A0A968GGI9_9SPIO|nr:NFACT RNA binding domain-containing protein [Entomospira culicis]NIZ19869.1 DUF814 domain-containing protein [Entomospira culicis]NIZ70083.1 DUF814 domain-containing protein [Entomospira culicis]WDI37187.1 NFACT RNA binding domain-containing protein [Entomospira culicis]WDI38816.1 NFACT RNA binding domain-containing protein [Entomospira culicis]
MSDDVEKQSEHKDKPEVKRALNGSEIAVVLDEASLVGARIDKIYQDTYDTLVLELYQPPAKHYLVINFSAYSHLYVKSEHPKKYTKSLRFKELLTAKIKGARIITIDYSPYDRSVVFHVKRQDEEYRLVVLLWARASNGYLCDDTWRILDAFYRKKDGAEARALTSYLVQRAESSSHQCLDMTFSPINDSLNEAVKAYYCKEEVTKSEPWLDELRLLKARYTEALAKQVSEETLMERWHQVEERFFTQSFVEHQAYQKAWQAHQQERQTFFARAKQEKQRLIALEKKIALLEKKIAQEQNRFISVKKERLSPTFLRFKVEDWQILVGRNAKENDLLLRRYSRGLDYWLHAHQVAGGFVLIKYQKGAPLLDSVLQCALALAHYYSKARQQTEVEVIFTQVNALKRTKILGKVEVLRAKTLLYRYDRAFIERILAEYQAEF